MVLQISSTSQKAKKWLQISFFWGGGASTSILHLPLCIHGSISVQYKLILWEVLIKRGNSSLLVHSSKPAVVTGLKPRTRTHPGLPHGWQKPASWSSSLPLRICISEKAGLCSQISHSGNLMWGMGTPTYPTILYRSVTEVLCSRYWYNSCLEWIPNDAFSSQEEIPFFSSHLLSRREQNFL